MLYISFKELLEKVRPYITKQDTRLRKAITAEERLSVTLRFLATGHNFTDLEADFKISRMSISSIIMETCNAIYNSFKDEYLKLPQTAEEWKDLAKKTEERWQFPNCIGAADGKHIPILHPKDSGSDFYNYKGFFSVVLLAIVDYDYKFLFVDVGSQGRISDGGVYRNSSFNKALERGYLNLPDPEPLPSSDEPAWIHDKNDPIPYVFVADDAFPLGKNCMKPYPQTNLTDRKRIFNYRLSRMRRISENVFGIWGSRFRVFTTTMALSPDKVVTITLATIALHNLLRTKGKTLYTDDCALDKENEDGSLTPGSWRSVQNVCRNLGKNKDNHAQKSAENIRDILADHFYGPGAIPWQWNMLL